MNRQYFKIIWVPLIILMLNGAVFTQFSQDSVEADPHWKYYRLSPHKFAVLLPKMPVTDDFRNECESYTRNTYVAFADDRIFSVKVYADTKKRPPSW